MSKIEKIDVLSIPKDRKYLKKRKNRAMRRAAKKLEEAPKKPKYVF